MLTYFNTVLSGEAQPFWPHVALLSLSVLAGIAVGAGIIFESPAYSAAVHRVAKWLVIVGVAVESVCTVSLFAFDEGVSNLQQSKIIALEKRLAPRELTPEQIQFVAILVRPFSDTSFDMSMHVDIEPMRLLGEIEGAMVAGGWHEQAPADGNPTFNRGEGTILVGERTMIAVWVLYDPNDPKLLAAAAMLIWALRNEGIFTSDMHITKPAAWDAGVIHVWVGAKP